MKVWEVMEHESNSSMAIYGNRGEDHLVVEEIANDNDVISRNWRDCSAIVWSIEFVPFMIL